jgi:hypothetical protein
MRRIKRTIDKKKEEGKHRNHPPATTEKMEIKKSVRTRNFARPKEVLNGSAVNPNKP